MRYPITLLFIALTCLVGSSNVFGQTAPMSNNERVDLNEIIHHIRRNNGELSDELRGKYPIYNQGNIEYVSCLLKVNTEMFDAKQFELSGGVIGAQVKDIVSVRIPCLSIEELLSFEGIEDVQIAKKVRPLLDRAIKDVRADSVQYGIGLPEAYTGKDVLIGITDWGFDYSSPMFYDTLLQNTRILAAWDQFKTSGPAPTGFNYGTEFTTESDFINVGADTSNIYSYSTHGTHVAGIAGGSGAGTEYRGAAFESQFLFATFLVDEAAVLDAWQWMYDKAVEEGKRLVVNMSWGLHHVGALDGTSLLSQALDNFSEQDVVFVTSAGNNGNVNFHIQHEFANDTVQSRMEFYSSSSLETLWGQSIHLWGESGNELSTGIRVLNTSNQLLGESPWYSTVTTTSYVDTFLVIGSDTIWYNLSADESYPTNGRPQVRLRVKRPDSQYRIVLKLTAPSGTVHGWNVTELTSDVGNWGMPFSSTGSNSLVGDTDYGISAPACSNTTIAVASYTAQFLTGGGTLAGGAVSSFSSFGPRMDGELKPDISAPGQAIGSSISSYTDASYSSIATVDFNGRTYPFAKLSGTSMSSPMVAGVCALILDANPYLSSEQVKEIILETAREDQFTGVIPSDGNTRWGWGKLNAYAAVQLALNTIGVSELTHEKHTWTIVPNPAKTFISIDRLDLTSVELIQVVDMSGKVVKEFHSDFTQLMIESLNTGMYWLRIQTASSIEQQKFMKQ